MLICLLYTSSMEYSLNTFDKLYNNMKKIVVLGDMLELGEKEIEFHREIKMCIRDRCESARTISRKAKYSY